ncbi:MAG: M20/M25/M40 family metallo-hydrolase [Spirochaetaceae bacterium]|nr:M20/M25/M40 family metallo-hydrolase [Spirochaetaceae bacterium]
MNLTETEKQKIVSDMCRMIQCKTVSNLDDSLVEWNEFEKFRALLKEIFPKIYSACEFYKVGKTGIVHKIWGTGIGSADGASDTKHAVVLMAHYDVVPAEKEKWSFEPFAGDVVDGYIRGRGTMDTKGTLCACLEAVEASLLSGWKPKHDLYLCFSGEEEINGATCSEIVEWFKTNGISVDFVLDEGGAIVDNVFPGVDKRCAMIGTAEKGSVFMDVVVKGKSGHASAPPKCSAAGLVGKIVCQIEKAPCKAEFTAPVKQLFKIMGRNNKNPVLKFLLCNLWLTKPLLSFASSALGGELNAMLHTTCAVTMLEGSSSYNVLPSKASAGINFRLLGSDTVEKAKARIEKIARKAAGKKAEISVNVVSANNPSIESDTDCWQWKSLCEVVHQTWPEILVSPYLMLACSDSRHYCAITDKVYRFSGMYMSKADRAMIHGIDEKISIETLLKAVEFYKNLLDVL